MSLLAQLLIRVLGPVAMLAIFGTLLNPLMNQPSKLYRNVDVSQMVGQQLWPTLTLLATAVLLATAIWLPLAVFTARRGYHVGLTVAPVSVLAQAMAPFWLGIVGLLLFSTPAHLLPAAGALAIVLLGFLAHATYLRAISRQSLESESDEPTPTTR